MGRLKLSKAPKPSVVTEGGVRFHAAEQTVLFLQTPAVRVKLCRIIFARNDGNIYVDFPYHVSKNGLLSEVTFQSNDVGGATLELRKNGIEATTAVKYSHKRSGWARFSKHDKDDSQFPRRFAFPLTGPIGRLFEVHVFWLVGLKDLDGFRAIEKRIGFTFDDPEVHGVKIDARWWRKQAIRDHRVEPGNIVGPDNVRATHAQTRAEQRFSFLGAPRGFPLQDHVLMLEARPVRIPVQVDRPTIFFLGGWDQHERTTENPDPKTPTALAFLYPAG